MTSFNISQQIKQSVSRQLNRGMIGIKGMAPKNAKALWAFVLIFACLSLASCVNEWPEENCGKTFSLKLEFNTVMPYYYYDYTRAQEEDVQMLYIIRAYKLNKGELNENDWQEFSFTRNPNEGYDCEISLNLVPGEYRLIAWVDFCNNKGESLYYNTENFNGIKIKSPYTGNTDLRDAFRGYLDITYADWQKGADSLSGVIEMSRPLAKYEFISTDLKDFITNETRKYSRSEQPVSLDEYYVEFTYTQFMPDSYNLFTGRPNDSASGVSFRSELRPYGDNEVLLGMDYVFIDDSESGIAVQMAVYRKEDNKLVARTSSIRVPLKRSYDTIVKGSFLLSTSSDGVGINPDYEGDFVIFAPLEKDSE